MVKRGRRLQPTGCLKEILRPSRTDKKVVKGNDTRKEQSICSCLSKRSRKSSSALRISMMKEQG